MKSLYLLLNIGSISIPFLYSFHPKIKLYKKWKSLFLAIAITTTFFIIWDIIFTKIGVWGFNPDYYLGVKIFNLPIEEWLFFICIPYACVFTHYTLLHYFPKWEISKKITKLISVIILLILSILTIYSLSKLYTSINALVAIAVLLYAMKQHLEMLQKFYLTFLVMLIPFFIVNGVLTGSFILNEVVWYDNTENLGIRMFTIPIEDSIYAFSLILANLSLTQTFQTKLFLK
ncbi:lycopene cyclase domain-containing protein [Pontimicrobium sp. IMCC45349]|uniref:lycopene cyclase domain-containing protein n=1 Tax=Pontimicrobium sp. IMCC45349 TaxID=3391574 RepID=UPI0039A0E65A